MKRKHKLLAICAATALFAVPFACIGCSTEQHVAPQIEYGEWMTETAPTCENAGLEIRVALSDPNIIETRAIPALGHDWNTWETTAEPTCLVAGVQTRSCKTCENSDMRAVPAPGHSWGEWEVVLAADCEHEGTAFHVCERDEAHTEYATISALGHDFGDWVVTLAPTCTAPGVETRYCRNDNKHTEVRSIEPYGHEWGPAVTTVAATCTEPGERASICANDASHKQITTVKASGHDFGDWVTSVAPTESEDGVEMRVCRHDSSHITTRAVDALGSSDLTYLLNEDRASYSVRKKNHPVGTVYIPATHDGLPVTAIDDSAFVGCADIERVVFLGNNVKTIGRHAFMRCVSLKSIELPEGLISVSYLAFASCKELKSIHFPSTVREIGAINGAGHYTGPFMGNVLETITVAEGNEFYKVDGGCLIERATDTVIAGTINAVIPDYVTMIARQAFMSSGIERVRIPASVASIQAMAFRGCNELREVIFENGALTSLVDESITTSTEAIFGNCKNLERVVFSDNITIIGLYAFYSCPALREIVFGKNLQTIGGSAFGKCNAVEICEITASVTSISGSAFSGEAVKAVTVAEGNTTFIKDGSCIIDRTTDALVAGANDGIIPAYVKHIDNYAFYDRNVKSMDIPTSVSTIGEYAFLYCTGLTSLEIPASVESVGSYAFRYWTEKQTIIVKGFATQERADAVWGENWRKDCAAGIVYEGDGLRYILNADGTEYSVTRETSSCKLPGTVVIPATYKGLPVTEISASAFTGCETDSFVFYGNNLREIGPSAFQSCKNLQSLELPEGLMTVSQNTFSYCTDLKSIAFPSSVRKIGYSDIDQYYRPFQSCPALETITVAAGNEFYKVDGGCLIEIASNAVVTGTKTAVIPDYATEILEYAFSGSSIESVIIPSNVMKIGVHAFSRCENLREIIFENGGVTSIPATTFINCISLERVVLSDNITEIGTAAFAYCTSLREIVLGKNLQKIGTCAFMHCNDLQAIVIPKTVTSVASHAFRYWTENQTIVVKGFASEEEADKALGGNYWRRDCSAVIIYEGGAEE